EPGKFMWTREESLSSVISTEMVDLPVSKIMAKMEDEFGVEGCVSLCIYIYVCVYVLCDVFFIIFIDDGDDDDNDTLDETYLTRDEFNLHKLIIAVTSAGKIFGIDSNSGKNIWKIYVEDLSPYKVMSGQHVLPLFVQRSSSHFPHQPLCTVIGRSKATGKSMIFSFHPISGTPTTYESSSSEDTPPSTSSSLRGNLLPYKVTNAIMLAQFDVHFLHPLLLIDDQNKVHVVPSSAFEQVRKLSSSLFTFIADGAKGSVDGFRLVPARDGLWAQSTWSVDVGASGQTISAVYSKHPNEHVHSIGIVLEDRSVLYKYLNPNLIVVVTEGEDAEQKETLQKGVFSVHLIDGVTGDLIFHCVHRKARGPVNLIHSENWIVYSYWNQKHRRNELAVLELYEGERQSNASAFSSLHHPPQPIVMRQAYIFPSHITTLGVSMTEKGLTNKEILFAMESGSILGLPKVFIDPRRPEVVSPESREEGLIPYMPELPKPADRIINYYQLVHDIRHIKTAPSGLESTSLVFCFGLDLFFTRVTPSKMFDVLKEDFDYFFISSVLIGMIVVSIVSQKLAQRKLLHRAWK
ncbi:hypothetical protein HELRODRAFT_82224, partial [Helobdella robusta]|uniref:ER membrane protein complex subunit 1 n=1 Tax=Helobdella robusta TaxID=6412 RepID=T1G4P4_HELRO